MSRYIEYYFIAIISVYLILVTNHVGTMELGCTENLCYHYFKESTKWVGAKDACSTKSMELVTLETQAVRDTILNFTRNTAIDKDEYFWVGAHLDYNTKPESDACDYIITTHEGRTKLDTAPCSEQYKYICMKRLYASCWKNCPTVFNLEIHCPASQVLNDSVTWQRSRELCEEGIKVLGHVGSKGVLDDIHNFRSQMDINEKYWLTYSIWNWNDGTELTIDQFTKGIFKAKFRCAKAKLEESNIPFQVESCTASTVIGYMCQKKPDTTTATLESTTYNTNRTPEATTSNKSSAPFSSPQKSISKIWIVVIIVGTIGVLAIIITITACVWYCRTKPKEDSDNSYEKRIDIMFQDATSSEPNYYNADPPNDQPGYATHIGSQTNLVKK